MDLFSELPQGVIHRILKFLPTKATTQTSVLSKSWKSAWDSRPIVDLDLKMLKPYEEKIPEFTMKALERYYPQSIPLLKSLSLIVCDGPPTLEVSGLVWITSIEVRSCSYLKRVNIHARNLRNFSFSGTRFSEIRPEITLAACDKSLEQLQLSEIEFPNKYWLQTMVSRFVSLENLDLHSLHNANNEAIKICSPSLRKLVIRYCKGFNEDTVIDAPNLRFAEFMDNEYPLFSLPRSNNLLRVQFSCSHRQIQPVNAHWLHILEKLFAKTNQYRKDVRMAVQCEPEAKQDVNKNFIFDISKSPLSVKDAVGRIFIRRHTIYIASSSDHDSKFIKDFSENVQRWRRSVRCCRLNRQKCWKHKVKRALKNMEIESLNLEQDINNIRVRGQSSFMNALLQPYQALSYKLVRINYSNKAKPS
ncbi:Putative F-box/FBD/LRR-repeat protein [Morus notabilis]|uniref:Putative F-box/FBD/LRR-repeat protein n=1 Tax=Morus notabilis TaxID=981085 RepID=W9T267_9ROSA|nr:Putative F-box/FBD/LRR-repeat protein [Morus notabilis]